MVNRQTLRGLFSFLISPKGNIKINLKVPPFVEILFRKL